jgi:hypothetical protein
VVGVSFGGKTRFGLESPSSTVPPIAKRAFPLMRKLCPGDENYSKRYAENKPVAPMYEKRGRKSRRNTPWISDSKMSEISRDWLWGTGGVDLRLKYLRSMTELWKSTRHGMEGSNAFAILNECIA